MQKPGRVCCVWASALDQNNHLATGCVNLPGYSRNTLQAFLRSCILFGWVVRCRESVSLVQPNPVSHLPLVYRLLSCCLNLACGLYIAFSHCWVIESCTLADMDWLLALRLCKGQWGPWLELARARKRCGQSVSWLWEKRLRPFSTASDRANMYAARVWFLWDLESRSLFWTYRER